METMEHRAVSDRICNAAETVSRSGIESWDRFRYRISEGSKET